MEITELMQKKLNNGREYRALTMNAINDDEFIVEGYATTFDEPYHLYSYEDENGNEIEVKEMVDKNAFANCDMTDVIFQYDHEGRVYARLSNNTMGLETDEHGLKTRAYLGGTNIGRNLYEEIKGGYTNKMSFGFIVNKAKMVRNSEGGYTRIIQEIKKLFDVSAVSYPQNEFTEISARKHCEGEIAAYETERLEAEKREHQKEELMNRLRGLRNGN